MKTRRRAVLAGCVLSLIGVAAACVPVTPPPPPPGGGGGGGGGGGTPPPAPLAPPPPQVGVPANSPALSYNKTFVTGLDRPWDVAFRPGAGGPDGMLLYTENDPGTVRAYIGTGQTNRQILDEADVDPSGEGGMMGIAFHPTQTNKVYLCFTSMSGDDNRVVQYTMNLMPDSTPAALVSPVPIVIGMQHAGAHNGCRIRFQPGASPPALFITMGDATNGSSPQSDTINNGKILRVTETGAPYPGNPGGRRWYTKGHRNPQGITFHPVTQTPFTSEHGPDMNDEINKLAVGGNSGWDPVPGYNQGVSMTDIAKFPSAMRPLWRSGDAGTIAPSGMTFLTGANWHSWAGSIVVAILKNSELRLFLVSSGGSITGHFQVPGSTGTRLRSAVLGPDGALYVATDVPGTSGAIWRITAA